MQKLHLIPAVHEMNLARAGFIARAAMMLIVSIFLLNTNALAEWDNTPEPVVLNANNLQSDFAGKLQYLLDDTWNLTPEDMQRPEIAHQFKPVEGETPDFGYTKSAIWLRFTIANETATERDWRLYFRENFFQIFRVYQTQDEGSFKALTLQNQQSVFSSRPTSHPELVVPIDLLPGTKVDFLVQYWSGGSSDLAFFIQTAESLESELSITSAKNFIYYGMMVILTVLALMALVVTRNPVFLAYACYSGAALGFIMHADGNGFKYIWPNAPHFNAFATIFFGSGMIGFGALFARLFLQTKKHHPIMDKLLIAAMTVVVGLVMGSAVFDQQQIKKLLVLVALISILLFTASGIVAARKRFKEVRFYVLAWTGALISSAIMTSRHWLGFGIPESVQFDSIRMVMVFDATFMGLAIWDRINQMRKANQTALEKNLEQAQLNLQMSERLQELETQYHKAVESVEHSDRQLVDTLHDLRQPLTALRLNVYNLAHNASSEPSDANDIERSFTYLENLVATHLQPKAAPAGVNSSPKNPDDIPETDIDSVLRGVHEMFLSDAQEKNLNFKYVPTTATAKIEPLVLMRIVSNLVSNAIKYTKSGSVLLGCRKHENGIMIQVHDSGPGLTEEEFELACTRALRLDNADQNIPGSGYGLSIVMDLATQHNLEIKRLPHRTTGLGIGLIIPVN